MDRAWAGNPWGRCSTYRIDSGSQSWNSVSVGWRAKSEACIGVVGYVKTYSPPPLRDLNTPQVT